MKITLRQAHKLIDKINSRLAQIRVTATQQVNIWEVSDPHTTFEVMREQFQNARTRHVELVCARQDLRDLIAEANHPRINKTVAHRKAALDSLGFLRHQLSTVSDHAVNTPAAFARKLVAEQEAHRSGSAAGYGSDTITVCLYTQDDVECINNLISSAQLEIEQIEDGLAKLNNTIEIVVPPNVIGVLERETLV